jgi:FkbM family methyltransferase
VKELHQKDIERSRVFGLKPLAARLLATRPINMLARRAIRSAGAKARLRLPLSFPHVEYQHGAVRVILAEPHVDMVARDIFWGRGQPQAPEDARLLRAVRLLCDGECTFLDIGSYDGIFALVAARSSEQVRAIAFEIVPENFLLIWRNIIGNDLALRVDARLLGIADEQGTMRMPARLGLSSLASSMSIGSSFESGVAVPLDTLDTVAAEIGGCLVMKIDVEGFEAAVFRGGTETLRRLRPDVICEFLPAAKETETIEALLKSLGYRFFQSLPEGFRENARIVPSSDGWNWLLTCRPDAEALIARAA